MRPLADTVYWMTPYVIGEAEADLLMGSLEKLLENPYHVAAYRGPAGRLPDRCFDVMVG